jgi:hypothetical protein
MSTQRQPGKRALRKISSSNGLWDLLSPEALMVAPALFPTCLPMVFIGPDAFFKKCSIIFKYFLDVFNFY